MAARWNDVVPETSPGTDVLHFADVAVVDPATGIVHRALKGFINPIDVLSDRTGGFFVADFGNATIYHVNPLMRPGPRDPIELRSIAAPEPAILSIIIIGSLAFVRRRSRAHLATWSAAEDAALHYRGGGGGPPSPGPPIGCGVLPAGALVMS